MVNERFLVALLPPEPVLAQVWALKREVQQLTGSRNAVRLPPHITLVPPTLQPAEFEAVCRRVLRCFVATRLPFAVGLENFAWFDTRTLFVRVTEAEALHEFHAALAAYCAVHLPAVPPESRPFAPHMTLATRDLPAAQVPELQQDFAARSFTARFEVRTITLFRHDGRQWVGVEEFALGA